MYSYSKACRIKENDYQNISYIVISRLIIKRRLSSEQPYYFVTACVKMYNLLKTNTRHLIDGHGFGVKCMFFHFLSC